MNSTELMTSRNVFRRPTKWYRFVGFACFVFGGWVLWANIRLSILGLAAEEWPEGFIQPIAWGIAAIEAAVSIFVTQPENWDDIYSGLEEIGSGKDGQRLPGLVSLLLAAIFLTLILGMCAGAYLFDFYSTHSGLYAIDAPVTLKTALFTLGYNLGTELLCFFGWQALRLAKIAERDQLKEEMVLDPEIEWRRQLARHRVGLAREQARDQIADEKASYQQQRRKGRDRRSD